MKDIIVRLWPTEPIPTSYCGLVKRSACIEGAWMAFARVKMHWAKMKATVMATEGPPKGKYHRKPKLYYESVLKGSCLVAE